MTGFNSAILHAKDKRRDPHGALRYPIYDCAAFEFESAHDIASSFDGSKPAHAYARVSNPTVEALEQRVVAMSGGRNCIAYSSGMAALTSVILTLCESGSNIVASRYLFGNTVSLLEKTLGPWGLQTTWIDPTDIRRIDAAINDATRLVLIETISNPQIIVADVPAIADRCAARNIPLVLDNSLATSYLHRSIDFRVPIEIISSTKYISGGGTSIGGLLIDNGIFDWSRSPKLERNISKWGKDTLAKTIRSFSARNTGACLSPDSAYLQMLGMETLSLRIDASGRNALQTAEYLEKHPAVGKVYYPGLPSSPFHAVSEKLFRGGNCGGLLSFDLAPGIDAAHFINSLKMIRRSSNFNDNKSLIIHPQSTIFCEYSKEELSSMGITDRMIRLSVGIEETEDIVADLDRALKPA